ncbi:MAG: T9SS type A sorting domain-containing protein [Flavobacteriales bacterium]|nr:T9SS type A sorting domain-containing protein [Flavobacteriales bacterium]
MKKFLLMTFMATVGLAMSAQVVELQLIQICPSTNPVCTLPMGIPANYVCAQLWAVMTNPTDVISTVYGVLGSPLSVTTDCCFWQSPVGVDIGAEINTSLFPFFPSLEYDSWVTVGMESISDPGGPIYVLESPSQQWIDSFNTPGCGGNIIMNDIFGGSWFTLPTAVNAVAGDDLMILLGQFTYCGNLNVNLNLQVFPGYTGPGSPSINQEGLTLAGSICGCLDPLACNYDAVAECDDLSCVYPCALTLESETHTDPTCSFDEDGEIEVTSSGGQGFVRYYIDGPGNANDDDGLQGSFSNLPNGTYTLTIVDEYFLPGAPGATACGIVGCQQQTVVTINTAPLVLSNGSNLNVTCFGLTDGSSSYDFAGGTGAIDFMPYNCTTNLQLTEGGIPVVLPSPDYDGFGVGSFKWKATDANGCVFEFPCFSLTQPLDLNVTIQATVASSCSDSPDGGVSLNWFGGGGSDVDFTFWADSADAGNYLEGNFFFDMFLPGTYNVYGIDGLGCTDVDTFTITAPAPVVVSATAAQTSCSYLGDGCVTGMATGGNLGVFTYSLDDITYQSAAQFCGLPAGEYTVYAHDNQQCEGMDMITVTAPAELVASVVGTDVTCFGFGNGQVNVTAAGGSPTYFYNIGLGNSTSGLFTSLGPMLQTIIVTDLNDCADTVSVLISEPNELLLTGTATSTLCNNSDDGAITVTATGGSPVYEYKEGNGSLQTSNVFGGLDANEYDITVVDANGCEFEIQVEVTEPSALAVSVIGNTDETTLNADDGTIDISINGGTAGYTFEWTNQATEVVSTDEDPENLEPGFYTVTVTDANGCTFELGNFVEIEITVAELSGGLIVSFNPNPTLGQFVLNMEGLNGEKVSYRIMDMQGRVVTERELGTQSGNSTEQVDITSCAAGVYYMNVILGEQQTTLKVVKN